MRTFDRTVSMLTVAEKSGSLVVAIFSMESVMRPPGPRSMFFHDLATNRIEVGTPVIQSHLSSGFPSSSFCARIECSLLTNLEVVGTPGRKRVEVIFYT